MRATRLAGIVGAALLIAAVLLLVAGEVRGKGAWVVWLRFVSLTSRSEAELGIRLETFTTRAACDTRAAHLDLVYGGVGVTSRDFRYNTYSWCISDTEAPRK